MSPAIISSKAEIQTSNERQAAVDHTDFLYEASYSKQVSNDSHHFWISSTDIGSIALPRGEPRTELRSPRCDQDGVELFKWNEALNFSKEQSAKLLSIT